MTYRMHAYYRANRELYTYPIRLRQIARRTATRGDLIFVNLRRRIALAELVAHTPGWSWPARARVFGGYPQHLAYAWRQQQRDQLRDADAADRARDAYWGKR